MSNSVVDWVRLVEADKSELGITLTEVEIHCDSKKTLNNFAKKSKTKFIKMKDSKFSSR